MHNYIYIKTGQATKRYTSTYVNLTAAAALVNQLSGAYRFAKNLQDNQGVEIYKLLSFL